MPSLRSGLPLSKQDELTLLIDVKDMLLRIAKLYQMKDFDPESSVLLAEWVIDEYKHTDYAIVKTALSKPPLSKEKTWRLTPEVIGEWIETTRQRLIDEDQRKESEKRQTSKIVFPEFKPEQEAKIDALLNETKSKLASIDQEKQKKQIPILDMAVPIAQSKTAGRLSIGNPRQAKLRKIVLEQKGALWRPKNFFELEGLKVPGDSIEEAKNFLALLTP